MAKKKAKSKKDACYHKVKRSYKGMVKMSIDQKIKEAKNEVLDLWAYLHAMEYYYGSKEDS
jgi:hypothetical protein